MRKSAGELRAATAYLLTGRVMHARLRPVRHSFEYPALYVMCNLAQLAQTRRWWFGIDRWAPLGLSTRDYGPRDGYPLEQWMRDTLAQAGIPADGELWLQTMPRIFGYAFNPVSFWYCYDRAGALRALYADVRNTFHAHHGYLLSAPDHAPIRDDTVLTCRKVFHVSPFADVTGSYDFWVRRRLGWMTVTVDYHDCEGLLLHTSLKLKAGPLTGLLATRALMTQPLSVVAVAARIHWQALRLWLKRVPFYGAHPAVKPTGTPASDIANHSLQDEETPS